MVVRQSNSASFIIAAGDVWVSPHLSQVHAYQAGSRARYWNKQVTNGLILICCCARLALAEEMNLRPSALS